MNTTDEETGKWVVLSYFLLDPVQVYGLFDSCEEAIAYAEKQMKFTAYEVRMVLNAHLEERREPWE